MTIAFILLGALPATLLLISRFGLSTPPQSHLVIERSTTRVSGTSREDVQLAA